VVWEVWKVVCAFAMHYWLLFWIVCLSPNRPGNTIRICWAL